MPGKQVDTVPGFIVLRGEGDADESEDITQHRCDEKERTGHHGDKEGRKAGDPDAEQLGSFPERGYPSGDQEKVLA